MERGQPATTTLSTITASVVAPLESIASAAAVNRKAIMSRQALLPSAAVALVAVLAISCVPNPAFGAGAIAEGFTIGDVLDESWGWFIVVGLGAVFAIVITIETKVEERYLGVSQTSEWFNTAGRVIKTGLTAAAIVSAWTWAATLLQSSTVAYQYGVSGPFWYAAGASIQVLLFGILAIELKRKAPNAHTFLEIIRARYGGGAHRVFLVFALMTNMIVTAMLLLGGAAVVNGLTGMDISLAAFLIPIGVMIYTLVGGLKATFVADYMHTIIIFIVILIFVSTVYFISPVTGGIEGMYDKLVEAARINPVEGNAAGAYLTMASIGGLIFGVINIVGNFGTVFVDQAYWQRAIAARPQSTVKGVPARGRLLVCHSVYACNYHGAYGRRAWRGFDAGAGPARAYGTRAAASVLMGEGGRRDGADHAVHGCHVCGIRRTDRRLVADHVRRVPDVQEPVGVGKAAAKGLARHHSRVRPGHGRPGGDTA